VRWSRLEQGCVKFKLITPIKRGGKKEKRTQNMHETKASYKEKRIGFVQE